MSRTELVQALWRRLVGRRIVLGGKATSIGGLLMYVMDPQQTSLSYTGYFSHPVLSLWGQGGIMIQGLLDAFGPYGVTLADIEAETAAARIVDQGVVARIGQFAKYQFRMDGVYFEILNPLERDLAQVPEILGSADNWAESATEEFSYVSRAFKFSGHYLLKDATSVDFLTAASDLSLGLLGRNRGTGLSFVGDLEEGVTRLQLTVDHSVVTDGGLFVEFKWMTLDASTGYASIMEEGEKVLEDALRELGLEGLEQ